MELDLEGQLADRAYPILASLVVPRPIALVTTIGPEGKVNAAPFSFFNVLGADPPIVAVAPATATTAHPRTPLATSGSRTSFVVNLVDEDLAEAMKQMRGLRCPMGKTSCRTQGCTRAHRRVVKPPRIAEAHVSLECKEWGTLQIGGNRIVIGLVKRIHLRERIVRSGEEAGEQRALTFSSAAWLPRIGIVEPGIGLS